MELRDYQEKISSEAAYKLKEFGCCYLSMECRTGKTITALAAAAKFGAKSILFVTKKKAIGGIESDIKQIQNETAPITACITNYESAHKVNGSFDLVILDEAHSIGAFPRPSNRCKIIREICVNTPVLYLSGTPSPEGYSQLYHQFWVCSKSPFKKYTNFYKWAKEYVNVKKVKINGYDINDYSHAIKEKIDEATRHLFISYSQEEAGFQCFIEEVVLFVPMKQRTANLFKELRKNKLVYVDGDVVLGDTPAKLLSKLHQLSSGTIIDESGKHIIIDATKAEFIKEHFKGKKIAIFYVFQSEFDLLTSVFPNYTSDPNTFQISSDKVFVSQVRSAREGVRLDSADALIFYNLEFSYLSYEQGRNRLSSMERTDSAKVYFVCSDFGVEKDVLSAVHGKNDFTLSYYVQKKRAGK